MTDPYYIRRKRISEVVVPDKRLGRHYVYDSRSAAYPYKRRAVDLAAVLHNRDIAILDQGNVGSCTGNAMDGCLGTDPLFATLPSLVLDESEALNLYSAAESIDGDGPYPPNDNGSSGTSVMQAALEAKLISGYTHALTLADMQDALQSVPVIIGINWYSSFDSPSSNGTISITRSAYIRGGHEVLVRGDDPSAMRLFADNSWGAAWGVNGSFLIPYDVMTRLLAEQGDCQVPVPLTAPAPVPVPVPTPVPAPDADLAYGADPRLIAWAARRHWGDNLYAAQQYSKWRAAHGY